MYDFATGGWTTVDDYPFGRNVLYFDIVFIPDITAYIVVGGQIGGQFSDRIDKFQNGIWSNAGKLNSGRNVKFRSFFQSYRSEFKSHRVQWTEEVLIVAGSSRPSEKCNLNANGEFNCVKILPALDEFDFCLSFLVPANYCN